MKIFLTYISAFAVIILTLGVFFSVFKKQESTLGFNNVSDYYRIFEEMGMMTGEDMAETEGVESQAYADPATFVSPDDIGFILDKNGSVASRVPDVRATTVEIGTGVALRLGVVVSNERGFDPALLKVSVLDKEGGQEILGVAVEEKENRKEYVATFIPKEAGVYKVSVEVLNTLYLGTSEISVFDRSLMKEIDIEEKDFLMDFKKIHSDSLATWESVSLEMPWVIEEKDGAWHWALDTPGYLDFVFGDEKLGTERALRVYRLAFVEKYKDAHVIPRFYKHILSLTDFLEKKDSDAKDAYGIFSFPPVNASLKGLSHVEFVDTETFSGMSYIYSGFFQAYDPATQPTYAYQGISRDGKYYIHFQHQLESDELKEYLEKMNDCKNDESQEKSEDCIEESFDVLAQSLTFQPKLVNLHDFVQSFQIEE